MTEHPAWVASGWFAILGILLAAIVVGLTMWRVAGEELHGGAATAFVVGFAVCPPVTLLLGLSLAVVAPLETRVVQFFGRYVGTIRRTGLVMTVPLATRRTINLRVNNFETRLLKVYDADANPVELAAIVVGHVDDTARAAFAVQDHVDFVQSRPRLRYGTSR